MECIKDMIIRLCPNGVKRIKLADCLEYEQPTKYQVTSKDYLDNGTPVLTAGQTFILGYTDETNGVYHASKENPVIIFDDFTTSFHWVDFDFKVKSSAMKMLTPCNEDVNFRFVYYAMKCIKYETLEHSRQWISTYSQFEIPLPPLEIQNRIVEILDKMTTLTAELEARKQQYEYYRNKLLTFNENGGGKQVAWKKISEIAKYPKARIKSEMLTVDTYVGVESLVKNRGGKTSSSSVPEGAAIEFLPQDILIGNIRPYLKKIWLSDCQGGTNGDVVCIRVIDSNEVMPKFLYHILASDAFFDYDNSHAKGGKMPRGDKNAILAYNIPVPSMEDQERIVAILDRFESLTTDLQIGLPAEIEARRQQYEYYRNKQLTFNQVA